MDWATISQKFHNLHPQFIATKLGHDLIETQ